MSTKAIQARIICKRPEQREWLWLTHRMFNEALVPLIKYVFKMKRGDPKEWGNRELADEMKLIYESIPKKIGSQQTHGRLEPITSRKAWGGQKQEAWAICAREVNKSGQILFDRDKDPQFGFSSEFWRKLCEMTSQLVHGHERLAELWQKEHGEWSKRKVNWESAHRDYFKVKPVLDKFEETVGGKVTKRRGRWHLYLSFLKTHPELAAWRGGNEQVAGFTPDEDKGLRQKFWRKPGKLVEIFLKRNPELRALDNEHGYYMREFVRPWARRRNADGYRHRPTFTLPSAEVHPAWYSFKKEATYKDLDLEAGSVSLRVLTGDTGKGRHGEWKTYRFAGDPRLRRGYRERNGLPPIEDIKGIKLVFQRGEPYLVFTCTFADVKPTVRVEWREEADESGKKRKRKIIPPGLVTCAVDLGVRNLAAATVRKDGKIVRSKFLWLADARLEHIAAHKRWLRALRRKRGKPVKGEQSFVELQDHTTDMGKDRFKKGARKIVDFAVENGAQALIVERLKYFVPDAERERGINKALIEWNRGNLVEWIEMLAADVGIQVIKVPAFYSSRFCSKCGAPGTRYGIVNERAERQWVGKLFACYECGYRANADHNASVNLHKILYGQMQTKKEAGVFEYTSEVVTSGGKTYEHETQWRKLLSKWGMEELKRDAPF